MENILKKIIYKKKNKNLEFKKKYSSNTLLNNIKSIKNFIDFKKRMNQRTADKQISIIAEIKKASPSAGLLLQNFNYLDIAKIYIENGASFLSVLTEEEFEAYNPRIKLSVSPRLARVG